MSSWGKRESDGQSYVKKDKPKIDSSSTENSVSLNHTQTLSQFKSRNDKNELRWKLVFIKNKPAALKNLASERAKAQKKQDVLEDNEDSDKIDNYHFYEGYEAGIITVKNMFEDNPKMNLETKLRKEEDRAISEKNKGEKRDDDEHLNYYDGYHSGIAHGTNLLRKMK